ncbi:hypothetical protein JZ751_002093 [Albula glossodonta]|uniref:RING-type E3 ubiquitin transferase n=1 Tax=Albula glossodonta TaxID=121402 RepID=A0A8T2PFU6_9TELE|nr:hypothetical protein JZ751_002093 [Albula glossodonta]
MAAVGPAKSSSGLIGQLEKQKNRNSCKHEQPEEKETAKLLSLEEARCPVCQEIFLEPVTMPCSHSVCLSCFKQTVQFTSLRCPLCRLRVSSWVRRQSREKGLVNTKLWDLVRQSYPERCTQRIERREGGEDVNEGGEEKNTASPKSGRIGGVLSDLENEEPVGRRTRHESSEACGAEKQKLYRHRGGKRERWMYSMAHCYG